MPTWKGMFTGRRFAVALVCTLAPLCALSTAGAAPTTTTGGGVIPTTTTTAPGVPSPSHPIPPPDQFSLPTDFGFQLVQKSEKAKADLAIAQLGIGPAKKALAAARKDNTAAQKRLTIMRDEAQQLSDQLVATRQHLAEVAAQAYMHAGEGELAAAISSITNANSAVDVGSKLHMITTYGDSERTSLNEYIDLKKRVDSELRDITTLANHTKKELDDASKHATDLQNLEKDASERIRSTLAGIAEFEKAATSASSPILGPSRLSANQMADYLMSTGAKPNITVSPLDLAQLYLDEGGKTGVRGDVAFAQSILETGGFREPGQRGDRQQLRGNRLVRLVRAWLQLPGRAYRSARAAPRAAHLRRSQLPGARLHRSHPFARHVEARLPRQGADVVGPLGDVGDGCALRPARVRHLREDGCVRDV
jgi:hypothetical protein